VLQQREHHPQPPVGDQGGLRHLAHGPKLLVPIGPR
jgi:hypothetical protein